MSFSLFQANGGGSDIHNAAVLNSDAHGARGLFDPVVADDRVDRMAIDGGNRGVGGGVSDDGISSCGSTLPMATGFGPYEGHYSSHPHSDVLLTDADENSGPSFGPTLGTPVVQPPMPKFASENVVLVIPADVASRTPPLAPRTPPELLLLAEATHKDEREDKLTNIMSQMMSTVKDAVSDMREKQNRISDRLDTVSSRLRRLEQSPVSSSSAAAMSEVSTRSSLLRCKEEDPWTHGKDPWSAKVKTEDGEARIESREEAEIPISKWYS